MDGWMDGRTDGRIIYIAYLCSHRKIFINVTTKFVRNIIMKNTCEWLEKTLNTRNRRVFLWY